MLYICGYRSIARGVVILFRNKFAYNIINVKSNSEGSYLYIDVKISDISIQIKVMPLIVTPLILTPTIFYGNFKINTGKGTILCYKLWRFHLVLEQN